MDTEVHSGDTNETQANEEVEGRWVEAEDAARSWALAGFFIGSAGVALSLIDFIVQVRRGSSNILANLHRLAFAIANWSFLAGIIIVLGDIAGYFDKRRPGN